MKASNRHPATGSQLETNLPPDPVLRKPEPAVGSKPRALSERVARLREKELRLSPIAAVNELFSKSPDGLREIVRAVMQEMLEAEMTDALGAEKRERTGARLGYRSGYYTRTLVTRVGKLELRVPQDRDGRVSTELFERYQRSE